MKKDQIILECKTRMEKVKIQQYNCDFILKPIFCYFIQTEKSQTELQENLSDVQTQVNTQ